MPYHVIWHHERMLEEYRTEYPSDVKDEELAFVAPYLALCTKDAALDGRTMF